jgi:hypothetical protein
LLKRDTDMIAIGLMEGTRLLTGKSSNNWHAHAAEFV